MNEAIPGYPICSQKWMASRGDVSFETMPVEHHCDLERDHEPPCHCSCGAWR